MVNDASASSPSESGTYFERIIITFSAFKMGAYSRWALIRGWALIRINTVLCFPTSGEKKKKGKRKTSGRTKKAHR